MSFFFVLLIDEDKEIFAVCGSVLVSSVKLLVLFVSFFSSEFVFGEIGTSTLLFCRLVYVHPNDKTAECRPSFAQKKGLNFENVCCLQSI